ncbi:MAG: gamma-glutamyltransferase [Ktedonobacterales bacterium]
MSATTPARQTRGSTELLPQFRAETLATHGMVAAPHALAAQAGLDLLKAGGNAVDAAIAANAMLQVVYPFVCGLGGDLFALVWDAPTQTLIGLNAGGRAPRAASIERYHALGYTRMPQHGIHSITVPGCASGWGMLAERFGRLGLARALQPAIGYAHDGFPVGPGLSRALARMDQVPYTHRSFREHYLPDGRIPAVGSLATATALADSLAVIASDGPAAFYRGALARRIAAFFAREGGLMTEDDLAAHQAQWVAPLSVPFAGLEICELPPNTQGVTALQMLGMTDGLTLGDDPLSALTVHLGVEAKKLAFADRAAYVTDSERMRLSPEELIAPAYLASRRALISAERASSVAAAAGHQGDTVYLCTVDGEGSAVSLIQSNFSGFGSGLVVDGAGISLQNRGAFFSLDPAAANALEPGKRTLHTLIPSMALRDGRPVVVFGAMGGDGQPQTHLQVYTHLLRYGMNIQAAIEAPRWVHGADDAGQAETLRLEPRFPGATVEALRALGHHVALAAPLDSAMGHANGIVIDTEAGVLHGGSDPRAEGAAVGW